MKYVSGAALFCFLLAAPSIVSAQSMPVDCVVVCPDGSRPTVKCADNRDPCPSSVRPKTPPGTGSTPSIDYDAQRRAREAADAQRRAREAADAQRRAREAADAQRRAREAADERRRREEAERQARFIRDRNAAANTLKGSGIGTRASPNDGGLKGSTAVNTGLNALRGSEGPPRGEAQAQQGAWKELHCAAALAGYALAAVTQATPDYQESSFLIDQAGRAMSGQALTVTCPPTPSFPAQGGRTVNIEEAKERQTALLSSAATVVERMRQRAGSAAAPIPRADAAAETPEARMRRVQQELNTANSAKVVGQTREAIQQQERDRQTITKLIVDNARVEKGELTSVTVNTSDEAPSRSTTRKRAPAPARP